MENYINIYYKFYRLKVILGLIVSGILTVVFLALSLTSKIKLFGFLFIMLIIAIIVSILLLVRNIKVMKRYQKINYDTVKKIELTVGHLDFRGIVRYDYIFGEKTLSTKNFFSTKIYKKITNKEIEDIEFYAAYSVGANEVLLLEKR